MTEVKDFSYPAVAESTLAVKNMLCRTQTAISDKLVNITEFPSALECLSIVSNEFREIKKWVAEELCTVTDMHPLHLTGLGLMTGLATAPLYIMYSETAGITAFAISSLIDFVDGEYAVLKDKRTLAGAYWDPIADKGRFLSGALAVGYGLVGTILVGSECGPELCLVLSLLIALLVDFASTCFRDPGVFQQILIIFKALIDPEAAPKDGQEVSSIRATDNGKIKTVIQTFSIALALASDNLTSVHLMTAAGVNSATVFGVKGIMDRLEISKDK